MRHFASIALCLLAWTVLAEPAAPKLTVTYDSDSDHVQCRWGYPESVMKDVVAFEIERGMGSQTDLFLINPQRCRDTWQTPPNGAFTWTDPSAPPEINLTYRVRARWEQGAGQFSQPKTVVRPQGEKAP